MVLELLKFYMVDIILVLGCIGALLWLYRKGKKKLVLRIVLAAVTKAEKALGSKTGPLKFADAMTYVYEKLPAIVRLCFTQKEIEDFIEDAVNDLREFLEKTGATLEGYEQERAS